MNFEHSEKVQDLQARLQDFMAGQVLPNEERYAEEVRTGERWKVVPVMEELKQESDSSVMMITHDLGVIAEISEDVIVMYAGQVVEYAKVRSIFAKPLHPYTHGLLRSIPRIDDIKRKKKLYSIEGNVPDPGSHPAGCRFHPRCPYMTEECVEEIPQLCEASAGHVVRCVHWDRIAQEDST